MLQEMRRARGDVPYGHTQQLNMYVAVGRKMARVQKMMALRMRPPLAAGPSVWHRKNQHIFHTTMAPLPKVHILAPCACVS